MLNRRQGLTSAAALAGLALTGQSARAQPPPAVVSLSEQRNRFLVDVGVDDADGYRFVLDTGATTHFISTKLVQQLRLPLVEQRMVRGYAGRNRESVVGIARFKVGGVEMGKSRAVAWEPMRLEEHDGLIGYPFLYPRAVVSLSAGRISLGAPEASPTLTPVRAQVMRNQTLLLGGTEGADGRFVFDTGAQACIISPAYHERIKETAAYKTAVQLVYRDAAGTPRTLAFRPAQMRFGDFVLASPVIRIGEADGREGVFQDVDGLFGVSLLRPYTWAIDQAAGTLLAGGQPAQPVAFHGSGLRFGRDGLIREIADGGPAFEAGLRPGQTVLTLSEAGSGRQVLELLDRGSRRVIELQTRALI